METTTAANALRTHAGWIVTIGVLMTIFGLLSIGSPLVTGIAIVYLVGGVLAVAGIVQIAHGLKGSAWGAGTAGLVIGAVALGCGVLMLLEPVINLGIITLVLAGWFVVDGVASIAAGVQLRRHGGSSWSILGGVVSLALGVLIWIEWPISGKWAIGVLVGVRLLMTGAAMIAMGMAARSAAVERA